jgi:phosphatidylserine decarboxylase
MSSDSTPIRFWNRKKACSETEDVYGDFFLRWVYETQTGQKLADWVLSKAWLSQVYGAYQSSRLSRAQISPFIEKFRIPMDDFEPGPFKTFNDFFIRQFKAGVRPFVQDSSKMAAFAEARYFAYEKVASDQGIPVKGKTLAVAGLLGDPQVARAFEGGPLLLARLCPVDYHRFHFPDEGAIVQQYRIHGGLHSVNPVALNYDPEIFVSNERQVSILETRNFGRLAYVEVGALCVGKIIQSHLGEIPFHRGSEKGYFLFGASTVIVLGQPGRWTPDSDLLQQTRLGVETLVELGTSVAHIN